MSLCPPISWRIEIGTWPPLPKSLWYYNSTPPCAIVCRPGVPLKKGAGTKERNEQGFPYKYPNKAIQLYIYTYTVLSWYLIYSLFLLFLLFLVVRESIDIYGIFEILRVEQNRQKREPKEQEKIWSADTVGTRTEGNKKNRSAWTRLAVSCSTLTRCILVIFRP